METLGLLAILFGLYVGFFFVVNCLGGGVCL